MTRLQSRFTLFAALVVATSCGDDSTSSSPTAPTDPAAVTVASLTVTLVAVGAEYQATAVAGFSDGSTVEVTTEAAWSTSDSTIATVSETGRVTTVSGGTVNVIATYQGVTGQTALTIDAAPDSTPPPTVTGLAVSASATTVTVGGTTTVTATATYSDDTTAAVTPAWTSSDAAVATVSADGTVTAVAAGTATITGTFGGHSGSADITVTTATTATGTLSGVVDTTGTGVAVAGATVAIVSGANNGRETESDDTGGYEFDALVPDLFEVRVTAAHFEATTFTVNLTDEVRRDVSLTLETPWTVAGTVTDSSQDVPAANVLVEGFFTDVGGPGADRYQPVGQTTTDASGYYSLSGFPGDPRPSASRLVTAGLPSKNLTCK